MFEKVGRILTGLKEQEELADLIALFILVRISVFCEALVLPNLNIFISISPVFSYSK